jgi:hypothetical protein
LLCTDRQGADALGAEHLLSAKEAQQYFKIKN